MSKTGVILAGGMGTRLAEPFAEPLVETRSPSRQTPLLKPWAELAGKTLLQHAYERLAPQVDEVFISVPKDFEGETLLGCPIIRDIEAAPIDGTVSSRSPIRKTGGPLVGIASILQYFQSQRPDASCDPEEAGEIITVPVDMPFLPRDIAARLAGVTREPGQPSYAFCGGRDFPTCALWPLSLAPQLMEWVVEEEMRAIYKALRRFGALRVEFADEHRNAFLNINSPKDMENAQSLIEAGFGVN